MGFRAGPLCDDEIVRLVSANFVPVAVDLYKIRNDRGPGGDLFRSVQRQMDTYQGWWIVSPEGKALKLEPQARPGFVMKEHVENNLKAINEALQEWGPLKPRQVKPTDPLPCRGRGVQPDGKVTLALYGRLLHQGQPDGPMVLDSVTFGASEWAQFAPPKKAGASGWTLPDTLARALARGLLSPGCSASVFRLEDFSQAELQAKVASVEGGRARILLSGKWKAAGFWAGEKSKPQGASATAEGVAVYDVEKKTMRSLFIVLDGKVWGESEKTARGTGAVVEWTLETAAAEKRRP